MLRRLHEARGRTRVFHLRHEVQEDEVDVLNFIRPGQDKLFSTHAGRHVAAQPHAVAVRHLGDLRHQFRLQRAINFICT